MNSVLPEINGLLTMARRQTPEIQRQRIRLQAWISSNYIAKIFFGLPP